MNPNHRDPGPHEDPWGEGGRWRGLGTVSESHSVFKDKKSKKNRKKSHEKDQEF